MSRLSTTVPGISSWGNAGVTQVSCQAVTLTFACEYLNNFTMILAKMMKTAKAYFHYKFEDAVTITGLVIMRIIYKPVAAAIAYGVDLFRGALKPVQQVLEDAAPPVSKMPHLAKLKWARESAKDKLGVKREQVNAILTRGAAIDTFRLKWMTQTCRMPGRLLTSSGKPTPTRADGR